MILVTQDVSDDVDIAYEEVVFVPRSEVESRQLQQPQQNDEEEENIYDEIILTSRIPPPVAPRPSKTTQNQHQIAAVSASNACRSAAAAQLENILRYLEL